MESLVLRERQDVLWQLSNLNSGATVGLEFIHSNKLKINCRFVGYLESDYIVLTLPKKYHHGFDDIIKPGHGVIFRAIVEQQSGACIAFNTAIVAVCEKPFSQIYLSYPKNIELINLRQQQRLVTHLPAEIKAQPNSVFSEIKGIVHDISPRGCRIKINWHDSGQELIDERVNIFIAMATLHEPIEVTAIIANVHRQDVDHLSVGVKFIDDESGHSIENQTLLQIFKKLEVPGYE